MTAPLSTKTTLSPGAAPFTRAGLFNGLAGAWSIDRTIEPQGALTGVAEFSPGDPGFLLYRETGELRLPHGSFPAERRYRFEHLTDGFCVWFDAEPLRLFHRIELVRAEDGTLTGEALHPCGRDTYLTSYAFAPDGTFSVRHKVNGPNKDYTMKTLYKRRTKRDIAA